jgi:hypothetical protein
MRYRNLADGEEYIDEPRGNRWVDDVVKLSGVVTDLVGTWTGIKKPKPTDKPMDLTTDDDDDNLGYDPRGGDGQGDGKEPMKTGTIVLISVGGLAVLGTIAYFIFRKKK